MPHYEYKVIPAPARAGKAKGVKTPEGRFAQTVESELNRLGQEGWEYLRAELLPSEERSGLTGSVTNWRTVLVFRRSRADAEDAFQPRVLETPADDPILTRAAPVVAVAAAATADPVEDTHAVEHTSPVDEPVAETAAAEQADVAEEKRVAASPFDEIVDRAKDSIAQSVDEQPNIVQMPSRSIEPDDDDETPRDDR